MKFRIVTSILLGTSLFGCQYHGPKNPPMPLIRDIMRPADREEYYALLDACKHIRRMHVAIADVRMGVDEAIEAGITLYLKNVNSLAALVLLRDLQNKQFRMD